MKPTNFAELLRYLQLNPVLECHMPASTLVVHGNLGNVDMSQPARILPRRFLKKSGNSLVFDKGDGNKTYLQFQSAKEFAFHDDRFEYVSPHGPAIQYVYKDA